MTQPLVLDEILVAGHWRRGGGEKMLSINPANGATNGVVHAASLNDLAECVEGAQQAFVQSGWRSALPHERSRVLHKIASAIEQQRDVLAALQTADTGKTLRETGALVGSAAATFRYVAGALESMEDEITPARGSSVASSVYEALGVVAAITPWNSPSASDAQKLAPALAAGNAVILKPAEWTPMVSLALARLITKCGLPTGLLSVLPGAGSVIGDALVRHPLVRKVSFTGGTQTGLKIAEAAAQKLMPLTLELGGKSPTMVLPDADRERALEGVLYGIFSSSGQSCIAGSRLLVQRDQFDDFVGALVERTRRLNVGLPDNPNTRVGPMVSFEHRDHVAQMVNQARENGARVLCGGQAPEGKIFDQGAYYLPTILDHVSPDDAICQEEVFGPVLVALPYDDEPDLIAQANNSQYGLACGIWTENYRSAHRLARQIECGTVWINTYKQFSASTPFSATRLSGLGTEKGRYGIRSYMRQKSVYLDLSDEPMNWSDTAKR